MKKPKKIVSIINKVGPGGIFIGILNISFGGAFLYVFIHDVFKDINEIIEYPLIATVMILAIVVAFACGILVLMNKSRSLGCIGILVSSFFWILSLILSIVYF